MSTARPRCRTSASARYWRRRIYDGSTAGDGTANAKPDLPYPEPVEGRTAGDAVLSNGMSAYLYMLRCADGSYYVGTTQASLEQRIAQHDAGTFDGYTARRRPVTLVFHEHFDRITDAIAAERQVKGWRREKKEALIRGDYAALRELSVALREALHERRASFDKLRMR